MIFGATRQGCQGSGNIFTRIVIVSFQARPCMHVAADRDGRKTPRSRLAAEGRRYTHDRCKRIPKSEEAGTFHSVSADLLVRCDDAAGAATFHAMKKQPWRSEIKFESP